MRCIFANFIRNNTSNLIERKGAERTTNDKPLCLVFLPGGDVVSVGVGEARQHHCALLLPRRSHRLSKPPGGENVDPGFHLPAIVVNSPGAAAIRSWPIRRT